MPLHDDLAELTGDGNKEEGPTTKPIDRERRSDSATQIEDSLARGKLNR